MNNHTRYSSVTDYTYNNNNNNNNNNNKLLNCHIASNNMFQF